MLEQKDKDYINDNVQDILETQATLLNINLENNKEIQDILEIPKRTKHVIKSLEYINENYKLIPIK